MDVIYFKMANHSSCQLLEIGIYSLGVLEQEKVALELELQGVLCPSTNIAGVILLQFLNQKVKESFL